MNIIYVEDNIHDAQLVTRYIDTTPHRLSVVPRIEEITPATLVNADMVLIDIIINHQRVGLPVIRQLRAEGFSKPIIAVTALSTPIDIREMYDAGVNFVLSKPFTIDQLVSMFESYC